MRKAKYTEELLRAMCEENDLEFLRTVIEFRSGKKRRVIYFICNKHREKGEQSLAVEKFVSNKRKCGYCNHSKLKETFVDEMAQLHPDIRILSKYKDWGTSIKCECLIDGRIWETSAASLFQGSGCPDCGKIKSGLSQRKSFDEVKRELYEQNPNIEIIGEYNGYHEYLKCKCLLDGCEWESITSNLLNGSAGCPDCRAKAAHDRCALTQQQFVDRMAKENPNYEVVGEYYSAYTPMEFRCRIHNVPFTTSPRTFLYKSGKGCPLCVQSNGEIKMNNILQNHNFEVENQYIFPDCKYINPLRYDGYDKSNRIAYEYQGQQHYYPVDFAGKGQKWAEEQFDVVQKRDAIKREYCKNNNIILIEIPYWEYDNMENFLIEEWKKYKVA